MSKKALIGIICAVVVALAGGTAAFVVTHQKKDDGQTKEVVEKEEEVNHDGQVKSYLTGEWIDQSIGRSRAVAVMTENTKAALPQYGINSAGVLYEAPVEGSITRMMAIYEDYADLTQMGNVRSCRPYYAQFAAEFDAIYVHFGQSVQGEQLLATGIVDNLSGLDGSLGDTFYRTSEHAAPHNAYTSAEGIASGIAKKGYDTQYDASYNGHYIFAEDDSPNTLSAGTDCVVVKPYYFYNHPYFIYNKDSQTYARYQFGAEQIDAVDGKQVEVSNIIFQNVNNSIYEGTQYLNITVSGSGEGKFFTQGKMIDITWRKGDDGITHYYDNDGNEIVLNQGKTWVCIIQSQYADDSAFYATEDEFSSAQ